MTLALASVGIAIVAGTLSVLSPCVWPLVPIVMTSASGQGRRGPLFLSLGLCLSFAIAGTFLTYLLISLGLNPDAFRDVAAVLLCIVGVTLVHQRLGEWVSQRLSSFSNRLKIGSGAAVGGQFGVGLLLGLVWLPCVGPTLGAAIAVASLGQEMGTAFIIMFAFGMGTAIALLVTAMISDSVLKRVRPGLLNKVVNAKALLGYLLLGLGLAILTGFDKSLESFALQLLPEWALAL